MIAFHDANDAELAALMRARCMEASPTGSFMTSVHRAAISIRSLITGLDANILSALISGEESVMQSYDDAIAEAEREWDRSGASILRRRREQLSTKIADMKAMEHRAGV